ncbi:MAG TPA: 3-dehydro-L-gulonate 2-dehydrogenase [Chitinophagaceae bacterium]|nr:3-dehydro-L-gulonate 2-dehydrogenase [Chitinophagaceae bacterium]
MFQLVSIPSKKMQSEFYKILITRGFKEENALQCARIFTKNSLDGVYSHGVNRFAGFIKLVDDGFIKPNNTPSLKSKHAGIEQWDGNLGAGPLNAIHATGTAIALSQQYGIGCVALSNTNHWMRGGTYGWHAAKKGFVFIGWTNTIANMPAWGAVDNRLGNNPLVLAVPYKEEAIVLDMAMSQYSFGKMELAKMRDEKLSMQGGYNKSGHLTNDPSEIIASRRLLPIGYWKGAGLSLLLDVLSTVLSGGISTSEISKSKVETGISQVFIAIDISKLHNHSSIPQMIGNIINDYHRSVTGDKSNKIVYPGERVLEIRKENLENGIPVLKNIWEEIIRL